MRLWISAASLLSFAIAVLAGKPCVQKQLRHDRMVCVCNATYCDTVDQVPTLAEGQFVQYTSNIEGLRLEQTFGTFNKTPRTCFNSREEMSIDGNKRYQSIIGFGSAFTDSAGINLNFLSFQTRENLLKSYFSPEGIEMNLGRVPIGGSDFSLRPYAYDDVEGDTALEHFNLTSEDFEYKIPLIKRAIALSRRQIRLMAAAWSAPIWMKSSRRYIGWGYLLDKYYQTWADYHIKFLDAYGKEGLEYWSVSTGNEPSDGLLPIPFNSLGWTPPSQLRWVREYFGPAIRNSKYNATKIITLDDQRFMLPLWTHCMTNDRKASQYIDGFAAHWYFDEWVTPWIMDGTHEIFPEKFIIITEASAAFLPWIKPKVALGSWYRGELYIENIFQNLNHWAGGWVDWNLALDVEGGPNWCHNFVDAAIIVNKDGDEFYKQPMFYALGHFAKFIPEGSVRIAITPQKESGVQSMAFVTPDNATVIILHNKRTSERPVTIRDPNKGYIHLVLSKKSFHSIVYPN